MAAGPASETREQWANRLRLLLSPKDSINADGSVKQEFYKPKKIVFVVDKKWGEAEKLKLYEGLEKYGVGAWKEMRAALLPEWDETALRIKSSRLLGSQSLVRYTNQKFTRAAVDAEQKVNHALGLKLGCWKSGVLVENDEGSVKKHFDALGAAAGPA